MSKEITPSSPLYDAPLHVRNIINRKISLPKGRFWHEPERGLVYIPEVMVSVAARDQPLPILLICKYLLSLVLGLGLLLTLVQSEFELQACLRALRIYSLAVVGVQVALQRVVPEASALHQGGGSGEGYGSAGFGKGKARNKAGKVGGGDVLSRR